MTGPFAGRVAVVTGASAGTGRELARLLHSRGARVLVTGRDADRTRAISRELGSPLLLADNLDLDTVAELGHRILNEADQIDYLFSNAGAALPDRHATREGNEANYQVNALAPLLLEGLLAPALTAAPRGRVVATSSRSHHGATLTRGNVSAELQDTDSGAHQRYARAKLAALIVHADARTQPGAVQTVDVHPGIVATDFGRYMGRTGAVLKFLATPFLSSPSSAADVLAANAARLDVDHSYYHRRTPRGPSVLVEDREVRDEVMKDVEQRLALWLSGS